MWEYKEMQIQIISNQGGCKKPAVYTGCRKKSCVLRKGSIH